MAPHLARPLAPYSFLQTARVEVSISEISYIALVRRIGRELSRNAPLEERQMSRSIFMRRWTGAALLLLLLTPAIFNARAADQQTDFTIDARSRKDVIANTLKILRERYVFPDVAKRMEEAIRGRVQRKEYDNVTSAKAFAKLLTDHLREVSHDKHIVVESSVAPIPERKNVEQTAQDREKDRARVRREESLGNYGFHKLERLSGNIGYMDMSAFYHAEFGGETAAASMAFLSNTDALIIDLRDNDGGRPDMVALLVSYLVDEPVELTGIYWRKDDRVQQSWTLPYVAGKKYLGKNVFILTSKEGTVSAAEALVYNLKILKRATIVGETTAGAANPGGMARVTEHFSMFVPTGRAYHPITRSNWEGVGIKPDIEVPASTALKTVHIEALKRLEASSRDEGQKQTLRGLIQAREKQQ